MGDITAALFTCAFITLAINCIILNYIIRKATKSEDVLSYLKRQTALLEAIALQQGVSEETLSKTLQKGLDDSAILKMRHESLLPLDGKTLDEVIAVLGEPTNQYGKDIKKCSWLSVSYAVRLQFDKNGVYIKDI